MRFSRTFSRAYSASHASVFAIKVVNEKRIPFEISIKEPDPKVLEDMKQVTNKIRKNAISNGTSELSEEEIEREIALARQGTGK